MISILWFTNRSAVATERKLPMRLSTSRKNVHCNNRPIGNVLKSVAIFFSIVVCFAGCSKLPAAPKRPKISARKAAIAAMALYDANRDGRIDSEELVARNCPLLVAKQHIDTDH